MKPFILIILLVLIGCGKDCPVGVIRDGNVVACFDHPYEAFGYIEPGDTIEIKNGHYGFGEKL